MNKTAIITGASRGIGLACALQLGGEGYQIAILDVNAEEEYRENLNQLKERGLRDKYIVMIGGAPVNESFCEQIGADYYTPDAASCAELAKKVVTERKAAN